MNGVTCRITEDFGGIADNRLDKLGNYFVYHGIRERYGITFERFVRLVDCGVWNKYIDGTWW